MGSTSARALWAVAVVVVLAAGWFFVSPLFIDEVVEEAFVIPSRSEVRGMSAAEREAAMDQTMRTVASMPDKTLEEGMPASEPALISTGMFRDADAVHRGEGSALLYELPDGQHLVRFEEFRVTNGPKLVVYLAEHPDPQSAADVLEGFLKLGDLKGNVGSQNYPLPAGTDVSNFGSVVIWCELFDVLFSPAALVASPGI